MHQAKQKVVIIISIKGTIYYIGQSCLTFMWVCMICANIDSIAIATSCWRQLYIYVLM